ncbi:hypothetical protein HME9302_00971 [Alteripontixanthobacter maritimus]|uniref:Uncharacterized protein n=1 Tax=Alteripontixanthobacter maritimus TaxID=2161824 RepID=A0A369Q9B9_9SPHN|nr:hypothetical protein [Alteripontixanthobacter maritimus]RDC59776.1 hypothetical protein HME9302_00971 [Alteripontixanthobacter maritimus]
MLKTVIESTEGLDEALIPLYAEADGRFILQIEGVDAHPQVANLKSAFERQKADNVTLKAERDTLKSKAGDYPDDFDAEKWAKLKDGKPDEAALVALRQTLEAERDTAIAERDAAKEAARRNALDRDLTDALTQAGVTNAAFAKAARTMLSDGVKIGDDGQPFVDTDMGPVSLSDHVKRWTAGEGKDFVTAPKGGGGKGGDGGGPKPLSEMGDAERLELAKAGKLKTQKE